METGVIALKVQRAVWQVEVEGRLGGEITGEQPPPPPRQGPCLQNCSWGVRPTLEAGCMPAGTSLGRKPLCWH